MAASQVMKRAGTSRIARTAHAWSMSPPSMAALSGPASTTTILRGEAAADFFTEGRGVARQGHGTEDIIEPCEWMIGAHGPALEDVVAVFTRHDDRVSAIGRLSGPSKVSLKLGDRRLHANQII
jgi:hypothetical protein